MRGFSVLDSTGSLKTIGSTGATGATGSTGSPGSAGTDGNVVLSYYQKIAGAFGDGNPNTLLYMLNCLGGGTVVNPTPTNISTSVARISYFMLPFDLTVNKIRYWSLAQVTGTYSVALYRYSDLARLTAQIDFDTPAGVNKWGAAGSSLNVSLSKNTLYFLACSVRTTGIVVGVAGFSTQPVTARPHSAVLPSANPGNLAAGNNYVGGAQFGQFAVTSGALPDPAATLAVVTSWTGSMPAFFLDNSNA